MAIGTTEGGVVCGETRRRLNLKGCDGDRDCERSYKLYIPESFCATDGFSKSSLDVHPLVFAIHCLGCSPDQMAHWEKVAEAYKFVLAIPEGIQNSWNARYCCGYALEKKLDDDGFLRQIILELSEEFSFVSNDVFYAMGWSNGGYMSTYSADLFRAVAPISGIQYDHFPTKATGLFAHHGIDDPLVRISGCCTNTSMPACCCGISTTSNQCTPTFTVFERWAKQVNKCTGEPRIANEINGKTCYSYFENCLAETRFCTHQNVGHFNRPSFKEAFPMTTAIADFFSIDACAINGGSWVSEMKQCSCVGAKGTYCMDRSKESARFRTNQQGHGALGLVTSLIICSGMGLLLWLIMKLKARKYNGWKPVPSSEVEMTSGASV